jgi:REP element-mobilizing transposase RayT
MASTLTRILIHVTFSTRHREPLIPESIEPDLHAYIGGICRRFESPLWTMGGTADHVHMLVSLSKKVALSDLLMEIKRDSSKLMKSTSPAFSWQDGYFGFSIGESGAAALREYIARQKEHHATIDFKEEMRAFMRKYGIEWDERYVWD